MTRRLSMSRSLSLTRRNKKPDVRPPGIKEDACQKEEDSKCLIARQAVEWVLEESGVAEISGARPRARLRR